jgi:hypothetical protein
MGHFGICPGPEGHKAWPAGHNVWPSGNLNVPLFVFFLALLYFFPCITMLVNIFSLGAQKHTK